MTHTPDTPTEPMSDESAPVQELPTVTATDAGRFSSISAFQLLLLTGCLVALGLTAARGLFETLPVAHASTTYRGACTALDEMLDTAREALVTGQELPQSDNSEATVTSFAGPFRVLRVESRAKDELIAAVWAGGSFQPAPAAHPVTPDELPRLTSASVRALLADPALEVRRVRHDTQFSSETLGGLIVVSPGVELVLRNVDLTGCVVSEGALSQDSLTSFNENRAPSLIIEGVLRIAPMPQLPGVSIVMPDGIVATKDDKASLQLQGAIVAHSLRLQGHGSLFGQIATLADADIEPTVERIGHGRVPQAWPVCLDMRGALRTDFIATVPAATRWADVQDLIGYRIP